MSLTPLIDGQFERFVKSLLSHAFTNSEFFTISEVAKFNPAQDRTAWEERNGRRPEVVEVYRKGEFVCDLHSLMKTEDMISKVWRNLELIKQKEVEKKNATSVSTSK